MLRHGWRVILIAVAFLTAALGNWNDTSTGINLDELQQFPLSRIRSGWLKDGSSVTFDGVTATAGRAGRDPREVRLRGVGRSGKRWEAHLCCLDEVWRADLDGNGTQDYVFFGSGPQFNGRTTPPFSLSILLMDREGIPVPFFTVVYQGENGAGVKHLVDLNHDGHAELLIGTYDENVSDARVGGFCSGHWTTQLYRFRNFGVEEIRGTMGGMRFPFIHDWTYWGGQCAEEEKPFLTVQPPALYEHGTSTQGEVTTTIRESSERNDLLAIDPVAGCKAIRQETVVYDRSRTREIGFPNLFTTYTADLAETIRRDGAQVRLRGIDTWLGNGDCSVNLLWATK
jgi:hypothetical protein